MLKHFGCSAEIASSSALVQQRDKINADAFPLLFTRKTDSNKLYKGLRLLAIETALLIADRGYENCNLLAHIQEKGWFFLIRIQEISNANRKSASKQFPALDALSLLLYFLALSLYLNDIGGSVGAGLTIGC